MKQYKQLTSELRYQIYGLKQAGLNQTEIAKKIGVDTRARFHGSSSVTRASAAGGQSRRSRSEMSAGKPARMASASHRMNGRKSSG